jgi:hypothetical protein
VAVTECIGHSRTVTALHSCTEQLDAKLQKLQDAKPLQLGDYSSSGSNNISESNSPVPHPPTAVMHHTGLPRMALGPGCLLQAALQACQLAAPQHPEQAGTSDLDCGLPAGQRDNLAWQSSQ